MKFFISCILVIVIIFSSCKNSPESRTKIRTMGELPEMPMSPEKVVNQDEEQLLRDASLEGDIEIVNELLAMNVNHNSVDQDGRTALMFSSFNGNFQIVKILVEKGADINLQDYTNRTALMFASSGSFPETVKYLLEKGAKPNLIDNQENFTALMFAAAEGHLEVVKLLLEYGADPSLKDVDGDSAESFARQNGHTELADFLSLQ